MKSIFLAAGYATRLYPITENFPKPLLPVDEKPILNWLLDDVDSMDEITEHIVVSNHKFLPFFQKWKEQLHYSKSIRILDDGTVDNKKRLGAVRDILLAVESCNIQEDVLIIAGDNLVDFSFRDFVKYAKEKGTSCVMCHEENDMQKQQKTAIITQNAQNVITSFEEKPKEPKGNLAVPPFYYYRREDLKLVKEAIKSGCNVDAPGSLAAWMSKKTQMHAWVMKGKRYDIGDMSGYEYVQKVWKNSYKR